MQSLHAGSKGTQILGTARHRSLAVPKPKGRTQAFESVVVGISVRSSSSKLCGWNFSRNDSSRRALLVEFSDDTGKWLVHTSNLSSNVCSYDAS